MIKNSSKVRTMLRARSVVSQHRLRVSNGQNRLRKKGAKGAHLSTTPGSLADDEARLVAIGSMIDSVFVHRRRYRRLAKAGSGEPRHYLFTACFDDGLIETEDLTDAQIAKVRSKADRIVRELGLHGVLALQIVGIRDTRTGSYHIWLHVHGLVWTYDRAFKADARAKALSKRAAYSNFLGAQSITLRSRRQSAKAFKGKTSKAFKPAFSRLHLDQTKASLSHLAYYLLHPPAYMQKVVPSKRNPAKAVMRSNSGDYPNWLAVKIHQLENQIPLERAVLSVGDGKLIRSAWKRAFSAIYKA